MSALTRRDVFGLAALAAAGRLPLLGTSRLPAAAAPVQGYLSEHAPASGSANPGLLVYDVLRWTRTDPETGETRNVKIGSLEIERVQEDGAVKLNVRQRTSYSQPVNRLEAEALCDDDAWLSMRCWKLKSWTEGREDSVYESEGEVVGSQWRSNDGISESMGRFQRPMISQWSLPIALAGGELEEGSVTLLEDLAAIKPRQTIRPGPEVRAPYQGKEHAFTSWVQTGPAVLPIHYLVDGNHLPQLMTQGALAWALQRAE